jgi:hypothetical protein
MADLTTADRVENFFPFRPGDIFPPGIPVRDLDLVRIPVRSLAVI